MTRPLHLILALGLTVLAVSPAAAQTQSKASAQPEAPRQDDRPISVDYMNAPLRNVLQSLSAFSGRTIVMRDDLGDPAVNASLSDVHWRRALDLILEKEGLVAKDDPSGVIKVDRRDAPREPKKR
jgi:type II secretory pathway component HofQ